MSDKGMGEGVVVTQMVERGGGCGCYRPRVVVDGRDKGLGRSGATGGVWWRSVMAVVLWPLAGIDDVDREEQEAGWLGCG